MATPGAIAPAEATAEATSPQRSAFVSTMLGSAPDCQASTRNRSMRRGRQRSASASTTSTLSMFAARTCGRPRSSDDARTTAVRRSRTATISPSRTTTQSPVVGRSDASVPRSPPSGECRSPPARTTRHAPRSARSTRPGSSPASDDISKLFASCSSHPQAPRAAHGPGAAVSVKPLVSQEVSFASPGCTEDTPFDLHCLVSRS